jgi:hypothetical protein
MEENMDIKRMVKTDLDSALPILVSAFTDSPFYRYIAPDEGDRRKFLAAMFRYRIGAGLEKNETYLATAEGHIVGIAA